MSAVRRRVVVTGVGMITPLGQDTESSWQGLVGAGNAVGPITRFDASELPVRFAAEVDDPGAEAADAALGAVLAARGAPDGLDADDRAHAVADLKGRLTAVAVAEALAQAGLCAALPAPERLGVCVGSEAARPPLDLVAARLADGTLPTTRELARMAPDAPTRLVARLIGARGPTSTTSTACTSSSQAVGEAMLRIRRGEVDAVVAGGVDVLVDPIMVTGFSLLGALSSRNDAPERASRPFDVDRDGFVLGEGAGFLVLEAAEVAASRGARPLAELTGFGCSCNAYRITDSPPDGRGAAQSMQAALLDAGLAPEAIGYVNAHGTSTSMNDSSETRGIQRALGDGPGGWGRSVAVSSTKSMTGHLVAACGAVELIVSLLAVRRGVLPPTINLDRPDPACELNHVAHVARQAAIQHALTNAFGFGGSNGSLIVSALAGRGA